MKLLFFGGPLDGREQDAEHWADLVPPESFRDDGWLLMPEAPRFPEDLPWEPARRLSLVEGQYERCPEWVDGGDLVYRWRSMEGAR